MTDSDERHVGIGLIDLLFAAVAEQYFEAGSRVDSVHAGLTLATAGVLFMSSWIAYHNTVDASEHQVRFLNIPVVGLVIDILLATDYWLLAHTVKREAEGDLTVGGELRWIAALFLVAAVLYAAWSGVSVWMAKSGHYGVLPGHWNRYRWLRMTEDEKGARVHLKFDPPLRPWERFNTHAPSWGLSATGHRLGVLARRRRRRGAVWIRCLCDRGRHRIPMLVGCLLVRVGAVAQSRKAQSSIPEG